MGIKGNKMTNDSVLATELLVEKLEPIGAISSRKMFGGHGIFHEEKMFALVNSQGDLYFKVDDSNRPQYEKEGSTSMGKMPYYAVSERVLNNYELLVEWASLSITLSKK